MTNEIYIFIYMRHENNATNENESSVALLLFDSNANICTALGMNADEKKIKKKIWSTKTQLQMQQRSLPSSLPIVNKKREKEWNNGDYYENYRRKYKLEK